MSRNDLFHEQSILIRYDGLFIFILRLCAIHSSYAGEYVNLCWKIRNPSAL